MLPTPIRWPEMAIDEIRPVSGLPPAPIAVSLRRGKAPEPASGVREKRVTMSGSGVQFTETMRGFASTSEVDDFAAGFERGKADDSPLEFTVTVKADDVDRLVDDREHEAELTGTVTAPALSPTPLRVEGGRFNLLVRDEEHAAARQMLYSMPLVADDGRRFFFEGYKQIIDDDGLDLWKDTTTLYVTVHEGDREGPVTAKGIVTIHLADFAKQITTMKGIGGDGRLDQLGALAKFGRMFAGSLNETFGGVFARPSAFNPDAPPREHRPLRCGPADVHFFRTDDDVELRLTRFNGGPKGPVILSPGLRNVVPGLHPRHHRDELPGVPLRARLRRLGPRLPRQPVARIGFDAVHPRRHRQVRLPGRLGQGARGLGRRVRAGDGALHRLPDPADVAGPRPQGRAPRRAVAGHPPSARGRAQRDARRHLRRQRPAGPRSRHPHHRSRRPVMVRQAVRTRPAALPRGRGGVRAAVLPATDVHLRRDLRPRPAQRRHPRAPPRGVRRREHDDAHARSPGSCAKATSSPPTATTSTCRRRTTCGCRSRSSTARTTGSSRRRAASSPTTSSSRPTAPISTRERSSPTTHTWTSSSARTPLATSIR